MKSGSCLFGRIFFLSIILDRLEILRILCAGHHTYGGFKMEILNASPIILPFAIMFVAVIKDELRKIRRSRSRFSHLIQG